uniref:Uncharacterized protein n=1 Tax=Anopheles epiroticus TaxID=199890 RepID=A0A182PFC2_9DIPT
MRGISVSPEKVSFKSPGKREEDADSREKMGSSEEVRFWFREREGGFRRRQRRLKAMVLLGKREQPLDTDGVSRRPARREHKPNVAFGGSGEHA